MNHLLIYWVYKWDERRSVNTIAIRRYTLNINISRPSLQCGAARRVIVSPLHSANNSPALPVWAVSVAHAATDSGRRCRLRAKKSNFTKFVPFTDQSLQKIADRIAADDVRPQTTREAEERSRGKAGKETAGASAASARKDKPNTAFVAGKQFPELFGIFPPELYGKPIEDLDEFYRNKYVSIFKPSLKLVIVSM